ncbi:MAG TPA: TraM recognition domain-containing protein [Candidatus Saccharimonadaceae bacterium]|nr:TraM recognition domain-containing protein [Candidatus Saccharimonadaceae bacterium]
MSGVIIAIVIILLVTVGIVIAYHQYQKILREAKNYERGLKMVPMYIHIPPMSDDIEGNGRDERDITEEVLSQAQVMYNIIASTVTKGLKSRVYGQRHISFEIVAHEGLVHYYVVTPIALIDVIQQAVSAAYPSARLEEVEERNIFNPAGRMSGTIGGEFTLKKDFAYPIATYEEAKRDATRALLNALSSASREDGVGIQMLIRPAQPGWAKTAVAVAEKIKKDKGVKSAIGGDGVKGLMEALWKPPETKESKPEDKQLSSLEQSTVQSIEDKTRYPGYETLIRVVASSNTSGKSQALLNNVVSAFSLFDSSTNNGFRFAVSKNIDEFVTAYLFRFFPQNVNENILNTVELATIFHMPSQSTIPTSQVQRQAAKQVDGPTHVMDEGFLLGYNEFRGARKPIRLANNDRRRHTYIIGQTGTGKSKLLENLAYQDMVDGKGFAFIDPHGDSAEELLGMVPKERVEDVIYFSPGDMEMPVGLNLFEFENQDQRDFLIQESIAMLYKLYDPGHTGIIGPRYEHWFRNAALTIMSDTDTGSTFIDVPQVFNDQSFTDEKLKHVTDRTVLDFWNKEMAQTSEANKSEVLGWFVSKFGAFLSNEMMRNIIGQTKSGFNLREVMDNKKILLVNLSKGKTGELNSQLLGMIFVMKFQAAAMGRADIPEDQREDFSLYVDEFQNFATDSFATILSEARKYRLSLVLANQFMTQLTDQIRESILGNIGTVISGRIGITDAEMLVKKFSPTFDAEDLTRLPNFQTIASVMINNVPSAAFTMSLIPPLGQSNPELRDALKKLSAAKYGRPRAQVEREIFARLGAGDSARKEKLEALKQAQQQRMAALQSSGNAHAAGSPPSSAPTQNPGAPKAAGGSSFLDEWLAKRQHIQTAPVGKPAQQTPDPAFGPTVPQQAPAPQPKQEHPKHDSSEPHKLHIRDAEKNTDHDHGVSIKLR